MLGVRAAPYAVGTERGLQPGDVRGRAQVGVDLHGTGERSARLVAVAVLDELPGGRLQRLGPQQRAPGLVITLRGGQQPWGIPIQQPAAVESIRLPVRDLRSGGQGDGVTGEGLGNAEVAGLGGEAYGVG